MEAFVVQNLICKIFIHKLPNLRINCASICIWGWRVCFTFTLLACVIRLNEMAFEVLQLHSCIKIIHIHVKCIYFQNKLHLFEWNIKNHTYAQCWFELGVLSSI
jgi:hypothetical protein